TLGNCGRGRHHYHKPPAEVLSKLTYSDLRSSNISDQAFSRAGFSARDKADLPLIRQRGGKETWEKADSTMLMGSLTRATLVLGSKQGKPQAGSHARVHWANKRQRLGVNMKRPILLLMLVILLA